MIVYLVGFSGCGKSTVGRRASRMAKCRFVDTDREIEKLENAKVSQIFATKGEEYFRRLETSIIQNIAQTYVVEDVIVATGGGLPCFGDNIEQLNRTGFTVYMASSHERLFNMLRLCRGRRPLVAAMDDQQLKLYIKNTLAVREPFYGRSRMRLECDGCSDQVLAQRVARLLLDCNVVSVQ